MRVKGGVFMEYSIAQVAEMTHLSKYTIRYYDQEGLLPFVGRTQGGVRVFSDGDLEWLGLICCLKNTGMHIRDIRAFIALSMEGDPTREKRLAILQRHKEQVETQMTELERNLQKLNCKIRCYSSENGCAPHMGKEAQASENQSLL